MDFGDFRNYSIEAYNNIIQQIRGNESSQIEGLTTLSTTLTYGDRELLSSFPIEIICAEIVRILSTTDNEVIGNLASSCIYAVLEAHHRSTANLMQANVLQVLKDKLTDIQWHETAENCILALDIISKFRAPEVGMQIGIGPLLDNIGAFSLPTQRKAIEASLRITNTFVSDEFSKYIEPLITISETTNNTAMKDSAIKVINNIGSHVSPGSIDEKVISSLCKSTKFLTTLINLSTKEQFSEKIISSNVDFESLFNESKTFEAQERVLKFALNMLPLITNVSSYDFPRHKRPKNSTTFANTIQPILIKVLLENPLLIFNDEPGIGLGPTREFFTLFSHELCKTERRLFRSDTNEPGMASCKSGMFFSPLMPIKAAKIFGTFLAKSIQTEYLIDININPCLFKFIRGENVNVEDVDPMLAQSLSRPEGLVGLTFIYPGLEFPLIEGGEDIIVEESNLNEFVSLIRDYTCGDKLNDLRDAFLEGFSEIFPFEYLKIFDENEICKILRGDNSKFTYEDLEQNVDVLHGYQKNSPQIRMLFEIMVEMTEEEQRLLIQFITGYSQLPIGGLAALEPKLTIAKRSFDDEKIDPNAQLPSVMTCTNYFKVPSYTTKEIMKEKIMLAIHEGLNSFQLS
ncbi:E3 ubiquitin-protein ligase UPL4-like isoform X1 [Histomonas meleagridis]|uniref:E3 ubiquitin-protein ligase UPL4-like isoform X1 n=1 Tax=Histomonas meleagridis TaxID=135588 RepID=UPI00355A3AFA|nr:E3 ubiquitin-protein ligase UPL4-like isoform X1 [Histomonas meleagridis]KAH0799994.1 E3 ubiquitin-protein ligase UPL4-like isoform X1 [Histomonas meleagridis]